MPILPIVLAGGIIALIWGLASRATTLRSVLRKIGDGTFEFSILKGDHVVHHDDFPYANAAAAQVAADLWISENPGA